MNQLLGCVANLVIISIHSGAVNSELNYAKSVHRQGLEELLLYKLFPFLGSMLTHSVDIPPTACHDAQISSMFIRVCMAKQGSHSTH